MPCREPWQADLCPFLRMICLSKPYQLGKICLKNPVIKGEELDKLIAQAPVTSEEPHQLG